MIRRLGDDHAADGAPGLARVVNAGGREWFATPKKSNVVRPTASTSPRSRGAPRRAASMIPFVGLLGNSPAVLPVHVAQSEFRRLEPRGVGRLRVSVGARQQMRRDGGERTTLIRCESSFFLSRDVVTPRACSAYW